MKSVYWLESFSEEKQTVKQVSNPVEDEIIFREEPVQHFQPDFFDPGSIVSIRTHSRFKPAVVDRIDCVISRSTGYDHLVEQDDLLGNLVVGSLSKYATDAVADHNLTVAFALSRKLPRSRTAIETFERNGLTGRELTSLDPGVVGVGEIGRTTGELLLNLGLNVRGHDPEHHPRLKASSRFNYTSLERLFENCNLVFLCLPHKRSTHRMIKEDLLGRLPDHSILVNSGRGEVVRNRTLLNNLRNGSLAGLGLDVFNQEESLRSHLREKSLDVDSEQPEVQAALELLRNDRVLATPHNAFNSRESVKNKVRQTLENIELFRKEGRVQHPVPGGNSPGD
jgi:D-lactate dehydrogenase